MSEIQEFISLLGEKQALRKLKAYVKSIDDPSPEFQIFIFIYSVVTGNAYAKQLNKISTEILVRLSEMSDIESNFYMDDYDFNITFKRIEKSAEAYITLLKIMHNEYCGDMDLNGLSDNDKLKVIEYIHRRDILWETELEDVAKQSEEFQFKYINKFAKYLDAHIMNIDYDGSFTANANKLLLKKLSGKTLLKVMIGDDVNPKWKAKIPQEMYEKAVLDFIKSEKKWSLSISGCSVYSPNITEFHKSPGLGLLNTALLKTLPTKEKKEFLKTKPSFIQSEKIKYAKKVYIYIKSEDVSIPLTNRKLIDAVLMIKTLEM